MFGPIPKHFFLTAGSGVASTGLNAFDAALLDAGVGDTNLIKMSSILPPACREISKFDFPKGSFVPLAYGDMVSDKVGQLISASVAVGIPEDPALAGLIMECSIIGPAQECEKKTRDMVIEGMLTIRGVKIKEIKSISASMTVNSIGAVFAAVVLCP
jgi:arginine decarboxylase